MKDDGMSDAVLSHALESLEVPEHAPGFDTRLRALLQEEAATRESRPETRRGRRPARGRSPRRRFEVWLPAAAVVIALIVVALTVSESSIRPRMATASEVRQRVARAWATTENIGGTLVFRSSPRTGAELSERRWSFFATERGDIRLSGLSRPGEIAYDARANVEHSLNPSESIPDSDVLFGAEIEGLAPGPPDQTSSIEILDGSLGSAVRALAASSGGEVEEVRYQGRAAWRLEADLPAHDEEEFWPDHLVAIVDREIGYPVSVLATNGDELMYEVRVEDLEVNGEAPEDAFTLEFPPGTEASRTDVGFRRVSLDEVAGAVGYDPLVPGELPEGYELSEVAVAQRAAPTGEFQSNPATIDAVSLSYRRGLNQIIVTTRLVRDERSAWSDPFVAGEGTIAEPERVSFDSGALAGSTGELVIDPMMEPHVWTLTEDLVVTVSGDLSREELMRVAESLEPR